MPKMPRKMPGWSAAFALAALLCAPLAAQAPPASASAPVATGERLWRATRAAPRTIARHWKFTLPVALTTAALITAVDRPASGAIHNFQLEHDSSNLSNGGLLIAEPVEVVIVSAVGAGCLLCSSAWRDLAAAGTIAAYAAAATEALKLAAERRRPYQADAGEFWDGYGTSFPFGHATISFALAAFLAHRYPRRHWVAFVAYPLAAAVSALRFTGKRHFPGDLFFGGVTGYELGRCAVLCN